MNAVFDKFPPMVPQVAEQPRTMLDTIHEAVMRGTPIEVIERLWVLQKEFVAEEARRKFDDAFAKAKAEIGVIDKDAHVGFKQKAGQGQGSSDKDSPRTDYDHDTLAGIYDASVPALSKYGLGHSFEIEQVMTPAINPGEFSQTITVTCIISGFGYSKHTKMSGPPDFEGKKTGLKAIASAITMMSRYSLRAALGLASRKDKSDDDGAAAEAAGIGEPKQEFISEAQLDELIALCDEVGAEKGSFCQWVSRWSKTNVDGLAKIRAKDFTRAKQGLEAKRGAIRDDERPANA